MSTSKATDKKLAGVKHDGGKPRPELLPVKPLLAISEVLAFGAEKYSDNNWRGGFKVTRLIGALLRHTYAWVAGEELDPESGLSHMAHAGCCVLFILEQIIEGTGEDDRFIP